jgi:DNA repair exonuclease SbcCD ATPase subunit
VSDGIEGRLTAGLAAQREQRSAGAGVSRLQRQVDGLYAETRHFAGRLDELTERLDRLEAKSRSWFGAMLSRNLDEQLELLRLETDEAEDRFEEARRNFEAARDELEQARERQDELAAGSADYDAALQDKEKRLLAEGDPRAARLAEIAAEQERQAVVLQDTDDLLTSISWSDRALDTLEHLIGGARRWAMNSPAGLLGNKATHDEHAAVGNAAAYAEQCLAKLKDELQAYGERQSSETGEPVDSKARFLDVWMDHPYQDLRSFLQIVEAQHRVPRTRSLLQQIGDDLRQRRAEVLTTIDKLTTERQRLLAK